MHRAPAVASVLQSLEILDPENREPLAHIVASGTFTTAADLLALAVERSWLTSFQAEQILAGRGEQLLQGAYVLLRPLGEGGMSKVFLARHRLLHRNVAFKVIRKAFIADAGEVAVQRFYQEMQAVGRLSHPNLIHAYDAGPVGGTHFLAMEYVDGIDLRPPRSPARTVAACRGLQLHLSGRARAAARLRMRPRPSRPEALQPSPRRGPGQRRAGRQDPRPGLGEPELAGRDSLAHGADRCERVSGHAGLHRARAGARSEERRHSRRPLQPGLHLLSLAGRYSAVSGRDDGAEAAVASRRGGAVDHDDPPGCARRHRCNHRAPAGEATRRPRSDSARAGERAGGR